MDVNDLPIERHAAFTISLSVRVNLRHTSFAIGAMKLKTNNERGFPVSNETPVRLAVSFRAPERTVIQLQGPTLDAYYEWLETEDDEAEVALAEAILDQCEGHIEMWTTLDEWDEVR